MRSLLKSLLEEFASNYEYLECEYHRCIGDEKYENERENGIVEYKLFEKLNQRFRKIYNLTENELVSDIYISNDNSVNIRIHNAERDTHRVEKVR